MIHEFRTPRGYTARIECRPETNDFNLANSIIAEDEYWLYRHTRSGWAVDVGAHIGAVSILLALDNPQLNVIALEPIPANADLLRSNIRLNGLSSRILVDERAATRPGVTSVQLHYGYREWGEHNPDYVKAHRFIGNQYRAEGAPTSTHYARGISLGTLLRTYGLDEIDFLKIDCEGCEWDFLQSTHLGRVRYLIGEMHAGAEGFWADAKPDGTHEEEWDPGCHKCREEFEHIGRLLSPTHEVNINPAREIFEAYLRG